MSKAAAYRDAVRRRRSFSRDGFATLADAGFDGEYVSPIQISSGNLEGPILVAKDWFDLPSAIQNREVLLRLGYMPGIKYNNVLDLAFELAGIERADVYLTQAFHLLVPTRSYPLKVADVRASFDGITRYELLGRRPIALGTDAGNVLRHFGIEFVPAPHPSARIGSNREKAEVIAEAVRTA